MRRVACEEEDDEPATDDELEKACEEGDEPATEEEPELVPFCDGCAKDIDGVRWKCTSCEVQAPTLPPPGHVQALAAGHAAALSCRPACASPLTPVCAAQAFDQCCACYAEFQADGGCHDRAHAFESAVPLGGLMMRAEAGARGEPVAA